MHHLLSMTGNRDRLTGLAFIAASLLLCACGGTATQTEKTPAPSETLSEKEQLTAAIQQSLKAAEKHFWEVIDCEQRDEENGMPTTTLGFPAATRSFLEPAEYTLYVAFPTSTATIPDVHGLLAEVMKTSIPEGYTLTGFEGGSEGQLKHATKAADFASIETRKDSEQLFMTIHPAQSAEIPWGNPCAQPKP